MHARILSGGEVKNEEQDLVSQYDSSLLDIKAEPISFKRTSPHKEYNHPTKKIIMDAEMSNDEGMCNTYSQNGFYMSAP